MTKIKTIEAGLILSHKIEPKGIKEWLKYNIVQSPYVWKTSEDFHYILSDGSRFCVPKGYECDLISVPLFLRWFMREYNSGIKAYIFHDYVYTNGIKREELGWKKAKDWCDKEMLYLSNKYNQKSKKSNKLRYLAVKYFGTSTYKN